MENEANRAENTPVEQTGGHEAHPHAGKRVLVGVGAVIALSIVVAVVWQQWGDEIKQACTGDQGACVVEVLDVPEEGEPTFDAPSGY